jgi:hypothetical protein
MKSSPELTLPLHSLLSTLNGRHGKHRLYCCWYHCLRGIVFNEPLLINGLHNSVFPPLLSADDIENTASSVVAGWIVFTELLPGNALIKSVTILPCLLCVCLCVCDVPLLNTYSDPFSRKLVSKLCHRWSHLHHNFLRRAKCCVWNTLEGTQSSDSDISRYVFISDLINYLFNIGLEPKSPLAISRWKHKNFLPQSYPLPVRVERWTVNCVNQR